MISGLLYELHFIESPPVIISASAATLGKNPFRYDVELFYLYTHIMLAYTGYGAIHENKLDLAPPRMKLETTFIAQFALP